MKYRIGVDVGERSVGLAAVEYDDDGTPIKILSAVSHIHDGGMDPDTAKSPVSRLATAGVARRARRLVRNRRRRLQRLDNLLTDLGYNMPQAEVPQTHDAWFVRAKLSKGFEPNDQVRNHELLLAIRHIARHRGWRNPWHTWRRLEEAVIPSENFKAMMADATTRFGPRVAECQTLGQLVIAIAASGAPIRPKKKAVVGSSNSPLMSRQIVQEDSLSELRQILAMQKLSLEDSDKICAEVFSQEKPHIPESRIGRCTLDPNDLRAPLAASEFQEFRILAVVANLRIGRAGRVLSDEQHDKVVELLSSWSSDERPRWTDVAELLTISPRELRQPSIDAEGGGAAPSNRTAIKIEKHFKEKTTVRKWWNSASSHDRSEFIAIITDLTGVDVETSSESLAEFMATWDEAIQESLDKLELESGRAAYSRTTLAKLNAVMREQRCDVHVARKLAFGVADDWQPPKPTFNDPIEHPAVSRVNVLVRRFLTTATQKWGAPETVIVEHVRGAFMGPTALRELENEIKNNTRRRDKTKAELASQGMENPSNTDVQRLETLTRQGSVCLYCGTSIGMRSSELDHILPRATGGGNRRDNLVAVCRECNAEKGKKAFVDFADHSGRPGVSLAEAITRVKNWEKGQMTFEQLKRLKRDVTKRLSMTSDEAEEVRSIESTAYAAREMRQRIESFLGITSSSVTDETTSRVLVFQGLITSEARKAGGIDDQLRLRAATKKSRFDRRHHAIDAAVITTLHAPIAKTLKERAEMHSVDRATGHEPGWKEFAGHTLEQQKQFSVWQRKIGELANLLVSAIAQDKIAVVRPLRLVPRVGSVHKDTISKLVSKPINDKFNEDELQRVVNTRILEKLLPLVNATGGLDAQPDRKSLLGIKKDEIHLFAERAAAIPVRGGSVEIGSTVQHARVYAWKTSKGFSYGMVRMFTGEFARIGFLKSGIDIFTEPLPATSQAVLRADSTLRKKIASGDAKQIGWITIGDEIEIDVESHKSKPGKLGDFLNLISDERWSLSGFFASDKISIIPRYLATEGVDEDATPLLVKEILKENRIPTSLNVLFSRPTCTVIRRSILGTVRWTGRGAPVSWVPGVEARKAFGE
jgi:CRISPR-associated endonuclease Csn1